MRRLKADLFARVRSSLPVNGKRLRVLAEVQEVH